MFLRKQRFPVFFSSLWPVVQGVVDATFGSTYAVDTVDQILSNALEGGWRLVFEGLVHVVHNVLEFPINVDLAHFSLQRVKINRDLVCLGPSSWAADTPVSCCSHLDSIHGRCCPESTF